MYVLCVASGWACLQCFANANLFLQIFCTANILKTFSQSIFFLGAVPGMLLFGWLRSGIIFWYLCTMVMGWKLFLIHCKDIAPRLHNWILCEISLQYYHLSDHYGRLPAILLSNVITMLAGMALPLAGGYVSFCILRFVQRNYISSFPKSGFSFSLMMKYQKK